MLKSSLLALHHPLHLELVVEGEGQRTLEVHFLGGVQMRVQKVYLQNVEAALEEEPFFGPSYIVEHGDLCYNLETLYLS